MTNDHIFERERKGERGVERENILELFFEKNIHMYFDIMNL